MNRGGDTADGKAFPAEENSAELKIKGTEGFFCVFCYKTSFIEKLPTVSLTEAYMLATLDCREESG